LKNNEFKRNRKTTVILFILKNKEVKIRGCKLFDEYNKLKIF